VRKRIVVLFVVAVAAVASAAGAAADGAVSIRFLVSASQALSLVPANLRAAVTRLRPAAERAVGAVGGDVAKAAALRDVVRAGIAPGVTSCYGYATVMNALGRELGLPVRLVAAGDGFSDFDTHTTVEVWAESAGRWEIEDPTFGGTFVDGRSDEPLGAAQLRDAVVAGTADDVDWVPSHARNAFPPSQYYVNPVFLFRYVGAYASVNGTVLLAVLPDSTMLSSGVAVVGEHALETDGPSVAASGVIAALDWVAARPTTLVGAPSYTAGTLWSGTVTLPATLDVGARSVVVWTSDPSATVDGDADTSVNGGGLSPIVAGGAITIGGSGIATLDVYGVRSFPIARVR
jgi:hypothetical protein